MDINKIPPFRLGGAKNVKPLYEVAKDYKPSNEVFPMGFHNFDAVMDGGVRGGELIVLSGQTSHGKTTFARILSSNFSRKQVPSLFFTYEMSPWYLKEKFVQMGEPDDNLIYSPVKLVENSIEFIGDRIEEASGEYACKVIFIDHLHYLVPLNQFSNTSLMIGGLVRELKKLAIKKDVIIFLIAHTKKIYQDEALSISSIRDSGLIAQESDYVFLIERLKKDQKKLSDTSNSEWLDESRITLAKNRRTGKMIYIDFLFQNEKFIEKSLDTDFNM